MILTHVKAYDENDLVVGKISIKDEINPYLVLQNEFDETVLSSYPTTLDYLLYQNMEENAVLDNVFLNHIWNSSRIGTSRFKLDEGLYFQVSPLGGTRYDRVLYQLVTNNFGPNNEVPDSILPELTEWIEDHGYQVSTSTILTEGVNVNYLDDDGNQAIAPSVFRTKIISPTVEGSLDGKKVSEGVFNLWKSIDNDRFMKVLPTKTNFGNHIILTQFSELTGSNDLNRGISYYKEIKVRVQYNLFNNDEIYINTINLLVNDYTESKIVIANGDNSLQIIGSNVSSTSEPIYVVKVVYDKNIIRSAIIIDLCMYDNSLIQ